MNKQHFRGQLQTIKNNFALAQVGIALMAEPDALGKFKRTLDIVAGHPEAKHFAYIDYVFRSDSDLAHATNQFRNAALRNCLKETFELVKSYGEDTQQEAIVKAAPWYKFLRMIRNSLSHDMHLRFTPYDLKQLPLTWSGLTINSSMASKPLQARGFLTRSKAVDLIDEVIAYVDAHVG